MVARLRKGQAFIELAVGIFVLALVLASLFSFANCIISYLDTQRSLRSEAGKTALLGLGDAETFSIASSSDTVAIEPLAAGYIFATDTFVVKTQVQLPNMTISK